MNWLSITADWLSIIGFIMTIFTLYKASKINNRLKELKKELLFKFRSEELVINLNEQIDSLSILLNAKAEEDHKLKAVLATCEAILENIEGKLPGDTTEISKLKQKIKKAKQSRIPFKDDIIFIYAELIKQSETLKNIIKDKI